MASQTIRKYDYIDALRGIAIALVVLVHASQTVKPVSDTLLRLMNEGARGVQLFYIASAITLCLSWNARRSTDRAPVRDFYLRRLFRIAPMFYLAILMFLFLNGTAASYFAPNGISWWFVPVTALFLHGFHPETINSVVPGGWSIAVEMTFYLVFPLLVRVRKIGYLSLLFVASLCLQKFNVPLSGAIFHYEANQKYLIEGFAFFNFIGQLPVFLLGMMTYWMIAGQRAIDYKFVVPAAVAFVGLLVEFWVPHQTFIASHVVAGGLFALFSVFLARVPVALVVNRVTILLGKLSFSMYLVHIAILKLLAGSRVVALFGEGNLGSIAFFAFVLALTAGVSWVTYHLIEKPGIALGRRLIDRLEEVRGADELSPKIIK